VSESSRHKDGTGVETVRKELEGKTKERKEERKKNKKKRGGK